MSNAFPPSEEAEKQTARGFYLRSTPAGLGFNPVEAKITLTTFRLRVEPTRPVSRTMRAALTAAGALDPVEFPLRPIRNVAIHEKRVWGKDDVLRIEFDNGGREYFWLQPATEWQAAILAARLAAPDLAYSTHPATQNGLEASPARSAGKVLLIFLGGAAALAYLCAVVALAAQALR